MISSFQLRELHHNTAIRRHTLSRGKPVSDIIIKPAYIAYTVTENGEDEDREDYWTKIGAAFPHHDGNGFNIALDALPVNGRIVLRRPRE